MSEGIKRMLAERDAIAAHAEAERRRRTIEPHRRAYTYGFDLVRRYLSHELRGDASDALAEGMVMGMMDGFIETAGEGWTYSEARKRLLEQLDRTKP